MLQIILLKLTLLLGVEVRSGETFKTILEPTESNGWMVVSERMEEGRLVRVENEYDMVLCATGKKVPLEGFERRCEGRRMAIAITANWENQNGKEEKKVEEIAGLARQNKMEFFKALEEEHNISLENLVHFKDQTHYFVMTATKENLLKKGVLREDTKDRDTILHPDNVARDILEQYALDAATFSTGYFSSKLPSLPLKDQVSIFDFTQLYSSKHACLVKQRKGHRLLLGLVGDSLLEPFWPDGLGISRGFLSVFDTAWMIKRFSSTEAEDQMYEIIKEREKLYSLQKTADDKLKTNFKDWSIDPNTRYPSSASVEIHREKILHLYDTDQCNV